MGAFHIKSLLLGIGIGIIITATASIIFLSGRDPAKELTEQQIVSLAEKYGMVKADILEQDSTGSSILHEQTQETTQEITQEQTKETSKGQIKEITKASTE